ncbi:MAG: phage integrase N-terminal SAM-like domain-containing protein [Anaerolineae bacterium]
MTCSCQKMCYNYVAVRLNYRNWLVTYPSRSGDSDASADQGHPKHAIAPAWHRVPGILPSAGRISRITTRLPTCRLWLFLSHSSNQLYSNFTERSIPMAKKLLDQLREVLRLKHYSYRTEEAYVDWVRRFILFHNKRHPAEMGAPEIQAFLAHLAQEKNVSASTQNQALSAILFLYRQVLHKEIDPVLLPSAKRPQRLPSALTRTGSGTPGA